MKEKYKKIAIKSRAVEALFTEILFLKHNYENEEHISSMMTKFMTEEQLQDKHYFNRVYRDLLALKYIKDVTFLDEYFLFNFPNRSRAERATFVGTDEYLRCTKKIKTKAVEENPTLKNKYLAYQTLEDYYGRDAIKIAGFEDYAEFAAFTSKHSRFLLKKITGSLGKNIFYYDLASPDVNARNLFLSAISNGEWIAEEIIQQSAELAAFHPSSVNTVRVATYYDNGNVTKLFAMFRMGSGGNVVDNASSGGICASVDLNTGIIESKGYKKNGEIVDMHPDTGHQIKGYQIPRWDELMRTVDEIAGKVPHYNYIGWDMALTDNGWVIIEGNSRPNVNSIQMCSGRGLRKILDETVGLTE